MKTILTILLFAFAINANSKFYKDLEFKSMENFKVEKVEEKIHISFDYVIYNPNWYKVVIKPSSLFLTIAEKDIGWVRIKEKLKLKKKVEAPYPVLLVGNSSDFVKGAFSSLWALLSGNGVDFNLKGQIKAGAFLLRKKFDIDYTYKMSYEEFMSFFSS